MSEIDEPAVPTVMKEITYDNFSKICRSCIINRGEIDVFEAHMQNVPLSNVIFSCTNELVTKTDGLSRVICNICMKLLINSYTFVKTFKESQVNLMNMHKVFKKQEYTLNKSSIPDISELECKNKQNGSYEDVEVRSKEGPNEKVHEVLDVELEKENDSNDDVLDNNSEEISEQETNNMSKKKGRKPNKRVEVDPKLRSDLDLQCFQCLEIFASKAEVVRHHKVTNHIMAPNYKCGICSKAISKRKAYWDHMAMHRHLKKKAVCEVCGAVVVSLHLKRHMLVHQEKTHVCQYCGKGYVQKNTLTDHVKRKHEGDEKDLNTLCFICGEICSDLKGLTTHLNTHTDDKLKGLSHHCEICGKYFLNAQSLSTHVYMAHKITERLPKQHKRSKTVRQKPKRLPREKNEDSDNTKESKPKRGKTESKKDTVKREPRECPTCHKMICYLGYSRHLTTHTGVKPHQCKQCSKSFRLFTSLKSHMYVHLDLKPFKCDICSQQFRHYTTLKVHKRVHTGEKPYKCLVCTKGFRSASGLKRHQNQRLHHKSKLGEDQNEVDALKNVENND